MQVDGKRTHNMEKPGACVTVVRNLNASRRTVFAAWTQPPLMQRWAVDAASVDPRAGGSFRQETRSADGVHVVSGEYREYVPERRLVMTWKHQARDDIEPSSETLVTVDLVERDRDRTELHVREEPIAPSERADAEAAWNGALDSLQTLVSTSAIQP